MYTKPIKVSCYQNQSKPHQWALWVAQLQSGRDTDSAMAGRSRCRARCFGRMGGVKVGQFFGCRDVSPSIVMKPLEATLNTSY